MIFATGRPRVAFCIASGPSLTAEDVELVRRWRLANTPEERRVIVVNTTFRMAPWADALFASNDPWWTWVRQEVGQFRGQKLCHPLSGLRMAGVRPASVTALGFKCSGEAAIRLAAVSGADRVYLLGYDCQKTDGKVHWHEDYQHMPNASNLDSWAEGFRQARNAFAHVEIINCTRTTALDVFPRRPLESVVDESTL